MGGSGRAGGITRGSEDGDAGADRQAQQGAATDARSVGDDIAEFNSADGREVLASFEEESRNERVAAGCEAGFSLPYS